ncbi:MAG: LysM peptidoglycan-binding domain-containing protein [Nonlabens sp.]
MKKLIIVILMVLAFAKAEQAHALQNYQVHEVQAGESLKFIANRYEVQVKDLIALNPDVQRKFRKGLTLLIPANSLGLTQRKLKKYKTHKVRSKQTLYALSKQYGVTVLDLKEANKRLYAEPLQRGDVIKVPVFTKVRETKDLSIVSDPDDGYRTYIVQPSEGFFRVAQNNNTSIEEIKELNPGVTELKPDMILKVPEKEVFSDKFMEYKVPARSGMYALKRLTGISEDSILAINPELKDGFKAGMTILIPNSNLTDRLALLSRDSNFANLLDSLQNFAPQKYAVMLPFSLQKRDSSTTTKNLLSQDKTLRIALDFYSGLAIARDSAASLGINVSYDIFDTKKNLQSTRTILASNDLEQYDAVVGPLLSNNVVEVSKRLLNKNIPVISPLTNTDVKLYSNLIQARPTDELLKQGLKNFLVTYAVGKNVILVTDNKEPKLKEEFKRLLPASKIIVPREKNNYIFMQDYLKMLDEEQENLVILAVDNLGFITDATNHYSSKADTFKITMVGMQGYEDMDISSQTFAKLNYIFPQMYMDQEDDSSFNTLYENRYGITPNKFATRGFDVGMDIILRKASASSLYESVIKDGRTIMVENKFDYNKQPMGGYYNNAIYLLQYQEDLTIKEIFVQK